MQFLYQHSPDSTSFLQLTGQLNNTLHCWHVTVTWTAVTLWPSVQGMGDTAWADLASAESKVPVQQSNTQVSLFLPELAKTCKHNSSRLIASTAKSCGHARTWAPAKPLLLVGVTAQYSDLSWNSKLIWWPFSSRSNIIQQSTKLI